MLKEEKVRLRGRLTPEQYRVCVERKTERPFTGEFWDNHESGSYRCVCCDNDLFSSKTKFDSGTGWPSFWEPTRRESVQEKFDCSLIFMRRVEVRCARCGAHLGHVFGDGPKPTGLRYCINSAALRLAKIDG